MQLFFTPLFSSLLLFTSPPRATPPLSRGRSHALSLHLPGPASGSGHAHRTFLGSLGAQSHPSPPAPEQSLSGCRLVLPLHRRCQLLALLDTDLHSPLPAPCNASKTPPLAQIPRTSPASLGRRSRSLPVQPRNPDNRLASISPPGPIAAVSQAPAPLCILPLPPDVNRPHPGP